MITFIQAWRLQAFQQDKVAVEWQEWAVLPNLAGARRPRTQSQDQNSRHLNSSRHPNSSCHLALGARWPGLIECLSTFSRMYARHKLRLLSDLYGPTSQI